MKKNYFTALLLAFSFSFIQAQTVKTKADSVMYLTPYVVVGAKPTQVNITGLYAMYVPKGILTEKVRIAYKNGVAWADYVFQPEYRLPTLSELDTYIKTNGHLPDVPTAKDVAQEGIDVAETQKVLLQKIEEMTLYILQQEKRIKSLERSRTNAKRKQ